jgi:hypothetical protein
MLFDRAEAGDIIVFGLLVGTGVKSNKATWTQR